MISSLRGVILKHDVPWITVDVSGVGYAVQCTSGLYESVAEGSEAQLFTYTFVREDRLELFGFASAAERKLFTHTLDIPGVGPRIALQICSVPMNILLHAVENEDARTLSSLKGIGKKMAEKLLVELQSLAERGIIVTSGDTQGSLSAALDEDVLEALANLGYDRKAILRKLREIPGDVKTTEEKVKLVLQAL